MPTKAKGLSPTARSMELLRKEGCAVDICERWVTFPERKFGRPTGKQIRIRKDLFGFADIIAASPTSRTITLIQTTSGSNQAARFSKILAAPEARAWLESGGLIVVHGWAQRGARGERKLWTCNTREVTLADMPVEEFVLTGS